MDILLKKLWPELKPYSGRLIFVLLFGIFVSGLKGLVPELINHLIKAWETKDISMAYIIPVLIGGVWILSGIFRYFHLFWMKYTTDLITVKIRRDLMKKYLSLDLGFLDNFSKGSGGLMSRLVSDINIIQEGTNKIADIFREPFMTFFMLGYLIYLDWTLTLFILAMTPVMAFILKKIGRSLRKYGHLNQESLEGLSKILKESLDGSKVIQSFNLQSIMENKFHNEAEFYLKTRRKIVTYEESAGPITESISALFLVSLLTYISFLVFKKEFSISEFSSFMFAMGFLLDSSKKIQNGYVKIQQASVATSRLQDILLKENPIKDPEKPKEFPENWSEIEFKNVNFQFNPENSLLKNINFKIKKGETIAFVGASGSGKSTLMNLLIRLYDPQSGGIYIDGQNIKDFKIKDLRKHIALVTQDVFLFSDSIEKNIQMGDLNKKETFEDVLNASKLANAHSFIESFPEKYKTKVGDRGNLLSGGEKQRISIARAIYKNAPLLILDEATSALDSLSEKDVQKGLEALMKGRTTFVIAHRLSTIISADRIYVFKNGQIIEEGNHQNLIEKKGEYFNFYQIQSQ